MTNSFPYLSDADYVLSQPKDESTGLAITGGAGTITFYDDASGVQLAGQTWPATVTWNGTLKRFEAPILATVVTTLGQLVRGVVTIDASNGKRYTDLLRVRVRAPSSQV